MPMINRCKKRIEINVKEYQKQCFEIVPSQTYKHF